MTDGQAVDSEYDMRGKETRTDPWGGGAFTHDYFPNGEVRQRQIPDGTALSQSFDVVGRLRSRIFTAGATTVSAWSPVLYDDADNRRSELVTQVQPEGFTEAGWGEYDYDRAHRLVFFQEPWGPTGPRNWTYDLDDAGNVLDDMEHTYTYATNRLATRREKLFGDPSHTYSYDHFGNQVANTETTGTTVLTTTTAYDGAGHPRTVTPPSGDPVGYAYDGLGRLVRRGEGSATTLFFHDRDSDVLALETDAAGSATVRYVLSGTGESLAQDRAGQPGRAYSVTDPRGNLTQLLDEDGTVRSTFAYDPFGEDRAGVGSQTAGWDSRLRFQMAPKDPVTGAYALGPRMYDPAINRFVGVDNYVGAAANLSLALDPLTGNRYMYAGSNPVNMIDDGHGPSCPSWLRWACQGVRWAGDRAWGAVRTAGEWTWDMLNTAARLGAENFHTVMGTVSFIACASSSGVACGLGLAAAFGVRTWKRVREHGWQASWDEIVADLTYTAGSFFLVKLPGKFLIQNVRGQWTLAHRATSLYLQYLVNPDNAWRLACGTSYEDPPRGRPPICL